MLLIRHRELRCLNFIGSALAGRSNNLFTLPFAYNLAPTHLSAPSIQSLFGLFCMYEPYLFDLSSSSLIIQSKVSILSRHSRPSIHSLFISLFGDLDLSQNIV